MARVSTICLLLAACDSPTPAAQEKAQPQINSREVQVQPAAVVLDGVALTQIFQRFFTSDSEILTAKQQRHLGSLSYEQADAALRNGSRYRAVNQHYVKTLREVLLQLCQAKTTQEMQALTASNRGATFAHHAVVKRHGAPQTEDINAIMTALFGYEDSHYGASDYAALIAQNLAALPVNSERYRRKLHNNYVLLCMAIGQDGRVYLR